MRRVRPFKRTSFSPFADFKTERKFSATPFLVFALAFALVLLFLSRRYFPKFFDAHEVTRGCIMLIYEADGDTFALLKRNGVDSMNVRLKWDIQKSFDFIIGKFSSFEDALFVSSHLNSKGIKHKIAQTNGRWIIKIYPDIKIDADDNFEELVGKLKRKLESETGEKVKVVMKKNPVVKFNITFRTKNTKICKRLENVLKANDMKFEVRYLGES